MATTRGKEFDVKPLFALIFVFLKLIHQQLLTHWIERSGYDHTM
jgi:hypothetical protein